MKQCWSAILVLIMGLQSFYPLAYYAYYYTNQDFFAAVFCENKEKPQLQCKGKCYLNKQLKEKEEKESKEKTTLKGIESLVYIPSILSAISHTNFTTETDFPFYRSEKYSFLFSKNCFRPPGV